MDLLYPHTGTIFWMFLAFLIVFFILKKFAWKPILNALKEREDSIESALHSADEARKQMEQLHADNEKIIAQAKLERDKIIKEASELKTSIVNDAKNQAANEADKIIENARNVISNEKNAALKEIKAQVAVLSVQIAEKLLQEKLADSEENKELIDKFLAEIKLN